jgi:hypothetical protein
MIFRGSAISSWQLRERMLFSKGSSSASTPGRSAITPSTQEKMGPDFHWQMHIPFCRSIVREGWKKIIETVRVFGATWTLNSQMCAALIEPCSGFSTRTLQQYLTFLAPSLTRSLFPNSMRPRFSAYAARLKLLVGKSSRDRCFRIRLGSKWKVRHHPPLPRHVASKS